MRQSKVCATCGTHYPLSGTYKVCPICNDDRQYIPEGGQRWTSTEELSSRYSVRAHRLSENVYELEITPVFAIGQRAFLILSPQGNILWDCIPLLNEPIIGFIKAHGGLRAIAFSHPHYWHAADQCRRTFLRQQHTACPSSFPGRNPVLQGYAGHFAQQAAYRRHVQLSQQDAVAAG